MADTSQAMRDWEKVRSDRKRPNKDGTDASYRYHAKSRDESRDRENIEERLDQSPGRVGRTITLGGEAQRKRARTERDESIRRTLDNKRNERQRERTLAMQRKNTTFYRSDQSLDGRRSRGDLRRRPGQRLRRQRRLRRESGR